MYNHTFSIRNRQQVVLPDTEWLIKLEEATKLESSGGLFTSIYTWFVQHKWITINQLQAVSRCFEERGI
jgi:hypothetical protein